MMLLTFSRRAAIEMQRRVERITAKVMGPKAGVLTDALAWSGTFTQSVHGSCGNTQPISASIRPLRFMTAKILPTL